MCINEKNILLHIPVTSGNHSVVNGDTDSGHVFIAANVTATRMHAQVTL